MRLLQTLLLLGGRPMTAGRNDDIGEPLFPPAACRRAASIGERRRGGRSRGRAGGPARRAPSHRRAC